MITNPSVTAILNTKQAMIVDLVSLTIRRGRVHQFDAGGNFIGVKEILDTVRWTSAPRALRTSPTAPDGGQVYQPIAGIAYQRGALKSSVGAEVLQISMSVAGTLPITLSTAQDGSGAFSTTLMELAMLGLLDGAAITIDQAVVAALPATPVQAASATYGVLSPDPVRKFSGVIRGPKPTSNSVEFECCDPLIQGGGSVPKNLFSPLCRWEFGSGSSAGVGCPVVRKLGAIPQATHLPIAGNSITFPTPNTIQMGVNFLLPNPQTVQMGISGAGAWPVLVPQDGPMMGMQLQVGNHVNGSTWEFADKLPWTWSCTSAHIEIGCAKAIQCTNGETMAWGCTQWAFLREDNGILESFGGFPNMPQPEAT